MRPSPPFAGFVAAALAGRQLPVDQPENAGA
jgi:hypothetical protein